MKMKVRTGEEKGRHLTTLIQKLDRKSEIKNNLK